MRDVKREERAVTQERRLMGEEMERDRQHRYRPLGAEDGETRQCAELQARMEGIVGFSLC